MKQCAIVTGGTRGIGLGIAKALAASGYNIVVTGTREVSDAPDLLKNEFDIDALFVQSNVANLAQQHICNSRD